MDFSEWDGKPIRQSKDMLGSARLRPGLFEKHMVNLRKNHIEGLDGWWPGYPSTDLEFFDATVHLKYEIERG